MILYFIFILQKDGAAREAGDVVGMWHRRGRRVNKKESRRIDIIVKITATEGCLDIFIENNRTYNGKIFEKLQPSTSRYLPVVHT